MPRHLPSDSIQKTGAPKFDQLIANWPVNVLRAAQILSMWSYESERIDKGLVGGIDATC